MKQQCQKVKFSEIWGPRPLPLWGHAPKLHRFSFLNQTYLPTKFWPDRDAFTKSEILTIFGPPQHFFPTGKNGLVGCIGRGNTRPTTWCTWKSLRENRLGAMVEWLEKLVDFDQNPSFSNFQTVTTFFSRRQKWSGWVRWTQKWQFYIGSWQLVLILEGFGSGGVVTAKNVEKFHLGACPRAPMGAENPKIVLGSSFGPRNLDLKFCVDRFMNKGSS